MTPTWLALWNRRKYCSHVALHNSAGQPRDYQVEAHAPRRRSQPCTCLLRGQAPEVPRRDRLVVLYACCLVSADSLSFSAAKQIVENIQAGAWTAAAVLEAFISRAGQAQEATNCLTEGARPNHIICFFWNSRFQCCSVLFEEAREEARKLDAEFAETGKLKGLLHGVPITLKDMSTSPVSLFVRGAPRN